MPNYPIFYSIQIQSFSYDKQNDKDSTQNVFSLNFSSEKSSSELKLKHIIKEFPIDLENENFHIRFKIECKEVQPKMYAWIDPSNLEARAPLINNAVYAKLIRLTKEGDSKLFNKQKIQKAKASIGNQEESATQKKEPLQVAPKAKQGFQHQQLHHANSDSVLHKQHMKSSEADLKNSQFKQKSTINLDQQKQQNKAKDLFDDDIFDGNKSSQSQSSNEKNVPKSANINFFESDDEEEQKPSRSAHNFESNSKPQNQFNVGEDLFSDDKPSQPMVFGQIENFIEGHNKAPQSEFDQILKSMEHEYIINGEMDGKKLIEVKEKILKILQEKQVKRNQEDNERKEREQVEKRDAKEKLQQKNWKEQNGTRKDIRTLLSTLQNVLWTGANWTPVSFFDLSTEESLKSTTKKVMLKFHPDRNMRESIENRYICEQIIDEIKQAQKEYESKQNK